MLVFNRDTRKLTTLVFTNGLYLEYSCGFVTVAWTEPQFLDQFILIDEVQA